MHGTEAASIMRKDLQYTGTIIGIYYGFYMRRNHHHTLDDPIHSRRNRQCSAGGYGEIRRLWCERSADEAAHEDEAHDGAYSLHIAVMVALLFFHLSLLVLLTAMMLGI